MSQKIKSEDIFDGGIFDILTTGAEEAQKKIALLNAELTKVGTSFKSELGGAKPTTIKEIESLISKTKELTDAVDKQTKVNTQQAELNKRNRLDEIRLQQAREKAVDDFNRKEQKENERATKENAKKLKQEQDLANAYKQLTINTRDLKNESKRLGAEMLELEKQGKKNSAEYYKLSRQYKETTRSAVVGDKALKKLDSQVGDNFRNVGNYQKAIGGLKNAFMQLGLAFGAIDIVKSLFNTQIQLDSLNLSLRNVSGSTKEYEANFAFLKDISLSYGQDLISIIESYKNFIASTQSSNLSLDQRKRIYESVIKAGSALALSNDNIKGSLLAISQMFSKGTVSAEELRQQLGERLPGAFGIMADSMGVTEAELGKLMKEGKVLADDVMPRFAIMLERSFGANAKSRLETFGGAWNVLKNNVALYFDQAQKNVGVNKTLAGVMLGLGKNIGTILDNVRLIIIAFVTYKASLIAIEIYIRLMSGTLIRATGALTGFGRALRGIGWGALVLGLVKLTDHFIELANQIDITRENYEKWKASTEQGSRNAAAFIALKDAELSVFTEKMRLEKEAGKINEQEFQKRIKRKKEELNFDIKEKGTQLFEHEKVLQAKLNEIRRYYIENAKDQIKKAYGGNISKEKIEEELKKFPIEPMMPKLNKIEKLALLSGKFLEKFGIDALNQYNQQVKDFKDFQNIKNELNRAIKYREGLGIYLNEEKTMSGKYSGGAGATDKGTLEHTKELRDLNVEYNKTNIYLSRQLEILKDIEEINAQNKLQETIDKTASILQQEEKNVNMTGKYNAGLVEIAVNTEYEARKEHEIKAFKKIEEDKKIRDKKTFDDELESVKEQEKTKMDSLMEINSDYYRRLNDYRKSIKEPNLSSAKQKELKKEAEWLEGERKDIEIKTKQIREGANKEEIQVYKNKIKREEDTYLEIEGLTIEHEGKLANIKRDSQTKTDEELAKLELIRAEKRLEMIKNTAESVNNLIQKSLEHYINMAERRIDMLDKRMDRMSTQADFLREKAVAGNIQAQESLAVIDKQEIDAQKERMNEQRSIQRLQIAMTVFQAYSNNIQNAKLGENPFTKTLTDITLLNQVIASIPTFIDGTETNIASALGKPQLQGQDGYIVRVDGSEKILNPQLSAMTGNMTTMEIAKLAEDFRRGDIMRKGEGAMQLNVGSWGTDMIISELQDLKNVIKNKPENQVEVAEILNGVMHIVETKKSGNTKVRNISRFS
jgi:tape measure domain-containing protein